MLADWRLSQFWYLEIRTRLRNFISSTHLELSVGDCPDYFPSYRGGSHWSKKWSELLLFFVFVLIFGFRFYSSLRKGKNGCPQSRSCHLEGTKCCQGDIDGICSCSGRWQPLENAPLERAEESQGILWYAGERWDQCCSRGRVKSQILSRATSSAACSFCLSFGTQMSLLQALPLTFWIMSFWGYLNSIFASESETMWSYTIALTGPNDSFSSLNNWQEFSLFSYWATTFAKSLSVSTTSNWYMEL